LYLQATTAMTKSLPPKSLVLYADDDADDRDLVKEAFDEFSSLIELVTFEEGGALLNYLHNLEPLQPKPCLVILDVNMHGLDGKQTLRRLRATDEYNQVPIVLFTTSTLPSEAAFASSYNAGFVTKPLYGKQINAIIDQLTDHCTDDLKEKIKKHRGY
jgi:CheY-like chemotaxis protein